MKPIALDSLPQLTGEHPGIGGRIKVEPEDFEVEEIPAYVPCGEGDFAFLWIEKRDMGHDYICKQVARRLNISKDEIGTAGMKDRRAVTRQWVSVPKAAESRLSALDGEGLRVLKVSRHGNKLRAGHLHGNKFVIRIRDIRCDAAEHLERTLCSLRTLGVMNYYGEQRFGREGETLELGCKLLQGQARIRDRFLFKLALSSVQSHLFNAYLAQRCRDGLVRQVLDGDVMGKWPNGGMFTVIDPTTEQARFDTREIVSMGPIFGAKMFPAQSQAAQREAAVLALAEVEAGAFAGFGKLLQGTRRHNLIYVDDLQGRIEGPDAILSFSLPAGSYATVLLEEVMKVEVSATHADASG